MKRSYLRPVSTKQRKVNRDIEAWAEAVKDRDDRWCQGPANGLKVECWGGIQAHHLNQDRKDNRLENGITLCPACHGWVHDHVGEAYDLGLLVHSWDRAS